MGISAPRIKLLFELRTSSPGALWDIHLAYLATCKLRSFLEYPYPGFPVGVFFICFYSSALRGLYGREFGAES